MLSIFAILWGSSANGRSFMSRSLLSGGLSQPSVIWGTVSTLTVMTSGVRMCPMIIRSVNYA